MKSKRRIIGNNCKFLWKRGGKTILFPLLCCVEKSKILSKLVGNWSREKEKSAQRTTNSIPLSSLATDYRVDGSSLHGGDASRGGEGSPRNLISDPPRK